MEKKIAILVRAGLPYRNTILYGCTRAREIGAKLLLVGVLPDMDISQRVSLSLHEFSSYDKISKKIEDETSEFLERAVQFCLDSGITVETRIESGGMEDVIKQLANEWSTKLVIVPTPTKKEHHYEFLDAIKHFAHEVLENEVRCPVVSVLAT